jgi:hypothetical protein
MAVNMAFAQAIDQRPEADLLWDRLGATREALLASQRRLPRNSAGWKAMDAIVHDIDALLPLVMAEARSTLLNLNGDSEFAFKSRTTGRRVTLFHRWGMKAGAMNNNETLEDFATRMRDKGRIGKYDVEHLQRAILADGLASRAEADLLIALDREVPSAHFSWPGFFIAALTEFAVWRSGRAGYIDRDKSLWLLGALACAGATHRATRALVQIAKEAECFDEAFFAGPSSREPQLLEPQLPDPQVLTTARRAAELSIAA